MTWLDQLPILVVLLPLMAAPLCMLIGPAIAAWGLTVGVAWTSLAGAALLFARVLECGPIDYAFGGWPPPWGIAYRIDLLSGFVLLVTLSFAMVSSFARRSVEAEIPRDCSPCTSGCRAPMPMRHRLSPPCSPRPLPRSRSMPGCAFNHGLMKGTLSLAVGALVYRNGGVRISRLAGTAKHMPWTFAALAIGGLSLIGIPGILGFISKWALVLAAMDRQLWSVVAIVLAGSLLALVYVWRILEAGWMGTDDSHGRTLREAPLSMLLPIWILALANLWFGLSTDLTLGVATRIADGLAGGAMP